MSEFETVEYSVVDNVARVIMNRPRAMNSFDTALRRELPLAIEQAACDNDVRVIVLSGNGRVFGAGADLKEFPAPSLTDQVNFEYRRSFEAVAKARKPVISSIHGSASGISLSLAMHCDLTIMADDAFLLSPFTTIGLVPDGGAHWLLVRQIGYKRAFEIIAEARRVMAAQALEWGLVNKVVPAAELETETLAWAQSLAQRAPLALAQMKRLLRLSQTAGFDEIFTAEATIQQSCCDSEDAQEGVQAFLDKRAPVFKGR